MGIGNGVTVIYVGASLYMEKILRDYIERMIRGSRLKIGQRIYLRHNSSELPLLIQDRIYDDENSPLLVLCEKDSFALVSKILATLGGDTLNAENGSVYPATASIVSNENYLYRINERDVNVINIVLNESTPEIMTGNGSIGVVNFFLDRHESAKFEDIITRMEGLSCFIGAAKSTDIRYTVWIDRYATEWECKEHLKSYMRRSITGDKIVERVIEYLSAHEKHITFAESCTGGLLASEFASIPGASAVLKGSFVAYSNDIKESWLGVDETTLLRHGAVSSECVEEMAHGAQKRSESEIAVAISGIAGPDGAVEGKPVGTVYICVRNGEKSAVERFQIDGDRNAVQRKSVENALDMIIMSEGERFFDFFDYDS